MPTFNSSHALNADAVRNVIEFSFADGAVSQKTVALFVNPSTHNRLCTADPASAVVLRNHDTFPSSASPTSTNPLSRATD